MACFQTHKTCGPEAQKRGREFPKTRRGLSRCPKLWDNQMGRGFQGGLAGGLVRRAVVAEYWCVGSEVRVLALESCFLGREEARPGPICSRPEHQVCPQ